EPDLGYRDLEHDQERDQKEKQQPEIRHSGDERATRVAAHAQSLGGPAPGTVRTQPREHLAQPEWRGTRRLRPRAVHCVTTTGLEESQESQSLSSQRKRPPMPWRSVFGCVTRICRPLASLTR